MLLNNLAEPEWITVDCNEPVTPHTLCVFFDENNQSTTTKTVSTKELNVYNKSCVIINGTCYLFLWIINQDQVPVQNYNKKPKFTNVTDFQMLFDSVAIEFPPILSYDMEYLINYRKYLNIYDCDRKVIDKSNLEGLYIFSQDKLSIFKGGNLFQCESTVYISILYICDGNVDCPGDIPTDEMGCICNNSLPYSTQCKYIINPSGARECSLFYVTGKDGTCHLSIFFKNKIERQLDENGKPTETYQSYLSQNSRNVLNKTQESLKLLNESLFSCANGRKLASFLINDLVADCSEAEDEYLLKQLNRFQHCPDKSYLPVEWDIQNVMKYQKYVIISLIQ